MSVPIVISVFVINFCNLSRLLIFKSAYKVSKKKSFNNHFSSIILQKSACFSEIGLFFPFNYALCIVNYELFRTFAAAFALSGGRNKLIKQIQFL